MLDFLPVPAGINIITMDEFLQREALTGKLYDSKNESIQYPPRNETDWNGKPLKELWEYVSHIRIPLQLRYSHIYQCN